MSAQERKLYHERLRPQFHFTARQWTEHKLNPARLEEGWMSDPNGLVYFDGEYHLFAQRWFKCWIHAVSTDLMHWEELPPAFGMDEEFGPTQSGTAVVDRGNSSGLGVGGKPPLVAFWSAGDNRRQCVSYSNDRGRTWRKYEKNPVLVHEHRDPKVFWHEPQKKWIMVLYGPPDDSYVFFSSQDLLTWEKLSSAPGFYECPDLFELPVDGDERRRKWVLVNGDGTYVVGQFDGTGFNSETEKLRCEWGPHFYATQTWNDIPPADGRRIQIAWMREGSYPDMPFNQQMTFPCELTLRAGADGPRLFRNPIREIEKLHGTRRAWDGKSLSAGAGLVLAAQGDTFHLKAEMEMTKGAEAVFTVRGAVVTVSPERLAMGEHAAPLASKGNRVTFEMLVDRTSIEAFANDGAASLSHCFLPTREGIAVRGEKGTVRVKALAVWDVESVWP